jgi:hypothetical protein
VGHLRTSGYAIQAVDLDDLAPIKRKHGVPAGLEGCHTGVVEGYVIEGHVPADLLDRLLRERPKVLGLAVPGMPSGSPGMDGPPERYQVLVFDRAGKTAVYATR